MLEYGQPAAETAAARSASEAPGAPRPSALFGLLARNKPLVLAMAVIGALAGIGLSKSLAPRYVATAEIYVDPTGLPGVDKGETPPGQDSNGFINYVESLSLIITSRSVLERVVRSERLDRDEEFIGGRSLLSNLLPSFLRRQEPAEERIDAAVRALGAQISVRRPERTFVLDLSVKSSDPEKAARLANATAQAFVAVRSAMQSDSAREATTALTSRLEALRAHVMTAERRVEDYKAQNGLVGVTAQQLSDMNHQLTLARARVDDTRARYQEIEAARRRGGDIGAIAVDLNLSSLGPLRLQQAQAQQKLADLSAHLGPRHPMVIDARAQVEQANRAVAGELARVAQAGLSDYQRAQTLVASLTRQFDALKTQTVDNGKASVGLRDLEREADAARNVYELFVTRSRQTGDIQQIDAIAPNLKIVSPAAAPIVRSFPPRASLMGAAGFLIGLAAGLALAALRDWGYLESMRGAWKTSSAPIARDRPAPRLAPVANIPERAQAPDRPPAQSAEPAPPAPPQKTPFLAITERSGLERRVSAQSLAQIDLTGLGFATLAQNADHSEFRAVYDVFDLYGRLRASRGKARSLAVVGANESGSRSALAINLALAAARDGFRVALIDAATWSARLTSAVREAADSPILAKGVFFDTVNGVVLALPKCHDPTLGRMRPHEALRYLAGETRNAIDLIICDGPDANEDEAAAVYGAVDDILLADSDSSPFDGDSRLTRLGGALAKVRAVVGVETAQTRRLETA